MPRKPTNVPPPQPVPTPVASPEEPSKAWPHRLRLAGLHDFEAARSSLKKQPNLLSEIKCLVLFDEALGIPALPSLLAQLKYLDELTISALSHHRILDWVTIPHDAQTALCRLFHYIKAVRFVRIQNLPLELFFHAERVEIVKLVRFTGFKTYDDPNQTDVPPCLTPRGRPAGSFWPLVELYVDGLNPGDFSTLFMGCVGQSTNPVWDLSQLRCFTWKTQTIRSMQPNMVVMNQFFAMIAISLKHLTLAAPLPATGADQALHPINVPPVMYLGDGLQHLTLHGFAGLETHSATDIRRYDCIPWIIQLFKSIHPMKRKMEQLTVVLHINNLDFQADPKEMMDWTGFWKMINEGHPNAKPMFKKVTFEIMIEHMRRQDRGYIRSRTKGFENVATVTVSEWEKYLYKRAKECNKGLETEVEVKRHHGHYRYHETYTLDDDDDSVESWES